MERWQIEDTYKKWWVGKRCKTATSLGAFKKVVDVVYYGNKIFGSAELIFEDGSTQRIYSRSYRPRKYDVLIYENLPTL